MAPAHQVNSDNVVDAVPPSWDSACQWGRWSLQRDNWTLVYQEEDYAIDLEDCNTSAELLDWILQIERKSWATPQSSLTFCMPSATFSIHRQTSAAAASANLDVARWPAHRIEPE